MAHLWIPRKRSCARDPPIFRALATAPQESRGSTARPVGRPRLTRLARDADRGQPSHVGRNAGPSSEPGALPSPLPGEKPPRVRQPRWPPAAGAERGRTEEVDPADCAANPGWPSIPGEVAAHSITADQASIRARSIVRTPCANAGKKLSASTRCPGAHRVSQTPPRADAQRTSNTTSRTRVRTAETSREPRQPSRLEKRKNTLVRCPEGRTSNPADCALCHHDPRHCTRSGDAAAPDPLRTVIPAPVGCPGTLACRPAAESSAGARSGGSNPGPADPFPPGRPGRLLSPAQLATPHTRCTSAASRSRAAPSSGRSTGTGSASPTSTVRGNT
jgi:hypothetical protein